MKRAKRKSCAHCNRREGTAHLPTCGFVVLGHVAPGTLVGFKRDGSIRRRNA